MIVQLNGQFRKTPLLLDSEILTPKSFRLDSSLKEVVHIHSNNSHAGLLLPLAKGTLGQ